jgi:hypothetical protein
MWCSQCRVQVCRRPGPVGKVKSTLVAGVARPDQYDSNAALMVVVGGSRECGPVGWWLAHGPAQVVGLGTTAWCAQGVQQGATALLRGSVLGAKALQVVGGVPESRGAKALTKTKGNDDEVGSGMLSISVEPGVDVGRRLGSPGPDLRSHTPEGSPRVARGSVQREDHERDGVKCTTC